MKRKMQFVNKIGKAAAAALAVCMISSACAASVQAEDLVDMVQDTGENATVKSYLTGEDVSEEIGRRRPVAVIVWLKLV